MVTVQIVKAKAKPKAKPKRKRRKSINWTDAKEFFITMNMESDKRVCSFKTVAEHIDVSWGAVRNRAAKDGWEKELLAAKEGRAAATALAVSDAHNKSMEQLQGKAINAEVEVRHRQASAARLMMSKGVQKLKTIIPVNLSAKEAIMLVRYGLQEERRALGIPDEIRVSGHTGAESREITPHDVHELVDNIIELVEAPDGTFQKPTEKV